MNIRTSHCSHLALFFDSEDRAKDEPNWVGMLRVIRRQIKLRKDAGWLHTFDSMSYLPSHNAGYIAFTVNFK